jgi:hypothetical protein
MLQANGRLLGPILRCSRARHPYNLQATELTDILAGCSGRTSELGDEVMRPSSFDLNGVPRNPQIVR